MTGSLEPLSLPKVYPRVYGGTSIEQQERRPWGTPRVYPRVYGGTGTAITTT